MYRCTRDNVLALWSNLVSDSIPLVFSLVSLNSLLGCNAELFFDVKKKETKANQKFHIYKCASTTSIELVF